MASTAGTHRCSRVAAAQVQWTAAKIAAVVVAQSAVLVAEYNFNIAEKTFVLFADPTHSFVSQFTLEGARQGPLAGLTLAVKDLYDVSSTQEQANYQDRGLYSLSCLLERATGCS